jgi:hypothetical protein
MGTVKTHDLAVKVGSYEKDGKTKGRYKNVGMILKKDDGGEMILIDPTFNFAAVTRPEGKDSVIVSKFDVKKEESKPKDEQEDW